ncbi:hypothetical protein GOB57_07965 [Sinorhizobium meliloti]|nr:hypothetical protein [Sinorhizobium meliloti]
MTLGPNPPWNQESAIHATADGKVRGFTVFPTVIDAVLYGLLGDLTVIGSPDDAQEKVQSILRETEAVMAVEGTLREVDTP